MQTHRLTTEQLDLISKARDEWLRIGLDTTPVDRAKVREILDRLCARANKPAPKEIIHLGSPLEVFSMIAKRTPTEKPKSKTITRIRYNALTAVLAHVRMRLPDHLWCQAAYQVRTQIRPQVCKYIGTDQGDYFFVEFIDKVTSEFVRRVRKQFSYPAAFTQAHESAYSAALNHIGNQVVDELCAKMDGKVRNATRIQFAVQINDATFTPIWMNLETGFAMFPPWNAWYEFFIRSGIEAFELTPLLDLAKTCGLSILTEDRAYISAKPEYIKLDEQQRLHCEAGAALCYPDGFSIFAIHGVRVTERIVVAPETITVAEIESEDNAEVRRVMIDRYGFEKFMLDSSAIEIHRDDFGVLYCKDGCNDEPMMMVKVVNATPGPDGSFKDYFLRVPPTMERARQAVAWTFGKEENDYAPAFQT